MNAYKCHLFSILLVSFTTGMIEDKCESPQYLIAGYSGIIACSFQEGFHTVLWYDSAYVAEGKSLLQSISGVKGGTGYYSGEYDIFENGSLTITNVTLKHEHNFTVFLLKSQDDDPVSFEVEVIVTVPAVPIVDGCNEHSYCVLEVETEGTLKCLLRGIRPKVLLEWKTFLDRDENLISFSNQQLDVNGNGSVYNVMLTSKFQIKNKTKNRITMECRTSGSNIESLQSTTQFDIRFANGQTTVQTTVEPLATVRSFPLWILAIILPLCMLAIVSCLFLIQRGRKRSQRQKKKECTLEEKAKMISSDVGESRPADDTESSHDPNSERYKEEVDSGLFLDGSMQNKPDSCKADETESSNDPQSGRSKEADSGSSLKSSMQSIPVATPRDGIETSIWKDGNPSVLLVNTTMQFSDKPNGIQKLKIGKGDFGYLGEKVILFMGETGTGKTTMINAMANYLLGNKWDDDHRYKLISDIEERKSGEKQVHSRTQWITSYTFHVENKWRYYFTLIDSPGFGDTGGRKRDDTLKRQMRVFFTNKGDSGIDHIDGVALVVNASMKRLTVHQKYVFDSVLDLFGKDIADNIFLLCTHATDDELEHGNPDVAEAVKEYKISYKKHFVFNNEFLYYQEKGERKFSGSGRASTVWEIGEDTLNEFIDAILDCTPKSLALSLKVLQERRNIEITVQSLHDHIKSTIIKMNAIQKEMNIFEEHKKKMEAHQSFKYTVEVEKSVREKLLNGEKAKNCTKCNQTCRYPCFNDFSPILRGTVETIRSLYGLSGCRMCTQNCDALDHKLESFRYKTIIETETRTKEDMKHKHDVAKSNMQFTLTLIQKITKEKDLARKRVKNTIEELRKCLVRLDEIALNTKPTSVHEILKNLKRQEIQAGQPGYKDRVEELEKLCENERKYENSGNETKI